MKQKSNITQKGYDLLMLLAISDRHYHESEARKILDFIKRHYHDRTLEVRSLKYYLKLSEEERLTQLIKCAEIFEGEEENKDLIIQFVLGVIFADRKFTEEERTRFSILERFWNFNLNSYIEQLSKKE